MADCLLALDQGTTSSRAIVFDGSGTAVASGQRELTQRYPRPGWVEQDPREILRTQIESAREALALARLGPTDVAAIGVANQRETTVVWDRHTGEPVTNAIVWQCRRTASLCEDLRARGLEEVIRRKTGLVLDAYFSGTKLKWILENVAGAAARAAEGDLLFGTVDAWLIWNLTGGVHATDPSNASRTMLYNIHEGCWDEELLAELGVPSSMLPEVKPSAGVLGVTRADALGGSIPIAGVAGDQQAALFGQGCFDEGSAKCTYGTGCFLLMNTGLKPAASEHGLLTTVAWDLGNGLRYALEGSVFVAGAAIQWLRDELGLIDAAEETETLAESVPDTCGAYLVPAFVGLGAPHWDMTARGALVGLTRGVTKAHLARAALESIAYQTAEVLESMCADTGKRLRELRVDGGAARNDFLMRFQAGILGTPVVRPSDTETTARGAACLAGLAVGFWPSPEALRAHRQDDARFEPDLADSERERLLGGWRRAVERARGWDA